VPIARLGAELNASSRHEEAIQFDFDPFVGCMTHIHKVWERWRAANSDVVS
jgi:hypothetical protein